MKSKKRCKQLAMRNRQNIVMIFKTALLGRFFVCDLSDLRSFKQTARGLGVRPNRAPDQTAICAQRRFLISR